MRSLLLLIALIGFAGAISTLTVTAYCLNTTTTSTTCSATSFTVVQTLQAGSCIPGYINLCSSSSTFEYYVLISSIQYDTYNASVYTNSQCSGVALASNIQSYCNGLCNNGYTETCSVGPEAPEIQSNVPVFDYVEGESYDYYSFIPTSSSFNLELKQDVTTSLSYVYIAQGYIPSFRDYEWSMTSSTMDTQAQELPGNGTYYIAVYGYYTGIQNEYTLTASDDSVVPLTQGQTYNGTLTSGGAKNFSIVIGENVRVASIVVKSNKGNPYISLLNYNGTRSSRSGSNLYCITMQFPPAGDYIYTLRAATGVSYEYVTAFYENPRTTCGFGVIDEIVDIAETHEEVKNHKTVQLN